MEWQYIVIFMEYDDKIETRLNNYGRNGWEVITLQNSSSGFNVYFKRPANAGY